MSETQEPYITASVTPINICAEEVTPTLAELKLIRRIRQARAQGRMLLIDCDAMTWYLVGRRENITHPY